MSNVTGTMKFKVQTGHVDEVIDALKRRSGVSKVLKLSRGKYRVSAQIQAANWDALSALRTSLENLPHIAGAKTNYHNV